tara:strand:+ start:334 stop:1101 length:768 start_codon:yes stop_codon:yes gene_type:complete
MNFLKKVNQRTQSFKAKLFVLLVITLSPFNLKAAVTAGNQSFAAWNPNATSYTISHNQNTGSDGYLVVVLGFTSLGTFGGTVSGITWNGVSMTQLQQAIININSGKLAIFELENPATGTNNLVITFSTTFQGSVSSSIFSFTGAQSGGNSEINTGDTTPTNPLFTISDNSMVLGISASNYSTSSIELAQGTARSLLNAGSQTYYGGICAVALSPALAAGTATYEANTSGGSASLALVEIQEAAAAVIPRRVFITD